ncbi:MAG: hypothetical protein ABIK28_21455 [Planctomycetota bacterium]
MKNTTRDHYVWICVSLFLLISHAAWLPAQDARMQEPRGMLLQKPPTQALEAVQSRFQQQHGGRLLWSPVTRIPTTISEMRARIAPSLSKETADVNLKAFIQTNRDLLGVNASELALLSLQTMEGRFYAKYVQTVNGIPVEGNEVGCILNEDGLLTRYASGFDPNMAIPTQGKLSNAEAVEKARGALENLGASAEISECKKVVMAQGNDRLNGYILVYKVFMMTDSRDQNPHQLVVIDANSGAVISKADATPWSITGTISGEVFPDRASDPTQTLPLRNLNVFAVSTAPNLPGLIATNSTNVSGAYSLATTPGSWNLSAILSGTFAKVSSISQTAVSHSAALQNGASLNITWNATGGDDLEQLTVFYHINRLHDELYKDTIGYDWVNAWTGTNQFLAATGYSFSNAYAGNPMTFGANSYARNADVIYHESTHNVLYSLFNGWVGYGGSSQERHSEAYAFDEGFADFFAAVLVNRATSNGRNLDNTLDYATNYTIATGQGLVGHTGGQIISGAAWDLRGLMQDKLGANLGSRANAKLVFKGLQTLAADPRPYRFSFPGTSNFLDALLRADDTNNNLSDGTPWDCQIFQAFRNHGLLPVDVFIADRAGDTGDVPSNPNGETWWISPDIYVDAPPFSVSGGVPVTESPEPNKENHVRVMVRNAGYLSASKVKVCLYAMNLLASPEKRIWNAVGSVYVNNIPVNGSVLCDSIPWTYQAGEILMAKLITADDPITEPYSVPYENNMAQRNYAVFLAWAGAKVKFPYSVFQIEKIDPDLLAQLTSTVNKDTSIDILHERIPENVVVRLDIPEGMASRLDRKVAPIRSRAEIAATLIQPFQIEEKPLVTGDEFQKQSKTAINDLDRAFAAQGSRPAVAKSLETKPVESVSKKAERLSIDVDSYQNIPVPLASEEPPMVSIQVPQNARPGEVYLFHVILKVQGEIVDGLTYEVRIAGRDGG